MSKKISGKFQQISYPEFSNRSKGLSSDPFPHESRKLTGAEHLFRIRVGDYRIIYEVIQEDKVITIIYIRHRSSAFKKL